MSVSLIGLGNILLKDEGVGVHVVTAIRQRYAFFPEVEIIDGGTMGLDLLPFFQEHDSILLVDAVDFGKEPGYIRTVEDSGIPSVLNTKLSVHHIGLSDILAAAKLVRAAPLKVCLIGIQPESLDVGLAMTDTVNEKIEALINLAVRKLGEWSIGHVYRNPLKSC